MKKVFFIALALIILGLLAFVLSIGKAPEDIERSDISEKEEMEEVENSNNLVDVTNQISLEDFDFSFVGYGPGKSHDGAFNKITVSEVGYDTEKQSVTKAKLTFHIESLTTDNEKLTSDLCKENFFDCEKYSEINFMLTDVVLNEDGTYTATGDLDFKGVTKTISFSVNKNEETKTVSSDFILDVEQFGFTAPSIVDKEVRIKFNAPYPEINQ